MGGVAGREGHQKSDKASCSGSLSTNKNLCVYVVLCLSKCMFITVFSIYITRRKGAKVDLA